MFRTKATRPSPLACALIGLGLMTATALVLHVMGQPLICRCGTVKLWQGDVMGPENSRQLIDWYSPSHVIHGLDFYALLWLNARRRPRGLRALVARLPVAVPIALAMLLDAAVGYMIRDNLPLNIIMLIWPLEAIKRWQAGA